jgi:hypothetical protein
MSYSDVTDSLENQGFDKTFLDLFTHADCYANEVSELESRLKTALCNRGDAAANLEHLIIAMSRRDEYSDMIERNGQNLIFRAVYSDHLYVIEIIPQEDNSTLRRWNRYPVTVISNK